MYNSIFYSARKRVERRHCVARLQQILAHGSAHDAKTDKTNSHANSSNIKFSYHPDNRPLTLG